MLSTQQGQQLLDSLLSEGSKFEIIATDFKEKLDLLRLQAEEQGPDPILSYRPEGDQAGTDFKSTAQVELKQLADWLVAFVKEFDQSKSDQVNEQIYEAHQLINMTQEIANKRLLLQEK